MKNFYGFIWFHEFFAWTFLNFLAHCVGMNLKIPILKLYRTLGDLCNVFHFQNWLLNLWTSQKIKPNFETLGVNTDAVIFVLCSVNDKTTMVNHVHKSKSPSKSAKCQMSRTKLSTILTIHHTCSCCSPSLHRLEQWRNHLCTTLLTWHPK